MTTFKRMRTTSLRTLKSTVAEFRSGILRPWNPRHLASDPAQRESSRPAETTLSQSLLWRSGRLASFPARDQYRSENHPQERRAWGRLPSVRFGEAGHDSCHPLRHRMAMRMTLTRSQPRNLLSIARSKSALSRGRPSRSRKKRISQICPRSKGVVPTLPLAIPCAAIGGGKDVM